MITMTVLIEKFFAWRPAPGSDDKAQSNIWGESALAKLDMFDSFKKELPPLLFDAAWYQDKYDPKPGKRLSDVATLEFYLKIGCRRLHNPVPWFHEDFYRSAYPDVRSGIVSGRWDCGYQHYLLRGALELRSPSAAFNELAYLGANPDVLEEVRARRALNGFFHYALFGKNESRVLKDLMLEPLLKLPLVRPHSSIAPSANFAESLYRQHNPDVVDDGEPSPGMRHWIHYGSHEDHLGNRQRVEGWVENVYLRENPDLRPYIGPGGLQSGYAHFLMYGFAENRRWAGAMTATREMAHFERAVHTRSLVTNQEAKSYPTISVIVPVYNPDVGALDACIESVRGQSNANWQLCLADDGSSIPEVIEALLRAEKSDVRIKVQFAPTNGGISAASNLALAQADGAIIALLDHDDILVPDALLHIARAFASASDVDMVYTDEGKISEDGRMILLNPKPDWSPELLLSTMYIGHLTAYRRALVEQVGGFRTEFDGTQDYDMALRMAEVARRVVHVPLPLYMWRMSSTSTAGSLQAKSGALKLQSRALESALLRRGQPGQVRRGHSDGHWRVTLTPPASNPLVSIVIPTAGRTGEIGGHSIDLVVNCIQSLVAMETYPNCEFVVVHNGDLRAETMQGLAAFSHVRLVHYDATSFNLSDKINLGVAEAAGSYVLLLNDDMQAASTGIIAAMLGRMFDGVGIVGGRLLYATGELQHAGVVWTAEGPTHAMIGEHRLTSGPAERLQNTHNCLAVSGACMFFRRDTFMDLKGFPPHLPTNYNDVALCLKVREAGLRIVFNPDATLFHFESLSKSGTYFWELQRLLLDHPGIEDPFLNPTFSRSSPFYELVDPAATVTPSYRAWMISRIDGRRHLRSQSAEIRFSLILSVYDTPAPFLLELEATLFNQTYQNWELILVDNGCRVEATVSWIERVRSHPRVTFVRLESNQGIMGGYGTAFREATGDYVVPIDSDDLLTLDCLDVLAHFLETHGMPDAVYSDEDKADAGSNMHSPFLKPDWDPVLFMNMCYVAHVCALRRTLAAEVGAYSDDAASGCHDWDSFLRMARAKATIMHVPEVLYSWRIHAGSTASIETGSKPYTITSQKHVLDQHLRLTGMSGAFEIVQNELFPHNGMWRLKPVVVAPSSAVLVLAAADPQQTALCLADLAIAARPDDCKVIVVGSDEISHSLKRLLKEFRAALWPDSDEPKAMTLAEAAALCNQEGRVLAVLDADVAQPSGDWLREGFGMFAAAPDVGAVGGQVRLPDGRVAWRAGFDGFGGMAASPDYGRQDSDSGYHGMGWCQRTCDAVPSACFFTRPALLEEGVATFAGEPTGARALSGQVILAARRAKMSILYTPFVQVTLNRNISVDPILPREWVLARSNAPNYYPAALGTTCRTAWQIVSPSARPSSHESHSS
ncbi:MAG: hypothetical protein B7X48_12895 [Acidiphilium sp. 34-60-192]|nr:MAG: hypothetical protein B7X48_12895 [Acidiphilium sp. 34-60-192]